MDATHGTATAALIALSLSIREYSIYQAIPLILGILRDLHPDADDEQLHDFLELRANAGLGFPGSDIEDMECFEEHGCLYVRLRLNMMSLAGADSPLPAFYVEQALGERDKPNATRDFLDVFNHRLQKLMVPAWRKYRYHAVFSSGATDPFSEQLFALIGLHGERLRETTELNWKRLLPYLGLLSLRAHSAALIESVLRYYFKHARLFIEQCVERAVDINAPQLNRLGKANSQLGRNALLGSRVPDRAGKFRIHIKQLDWDRFHEFLPIGPGYPPLGALVRFTLRDPLDYDICLELLNEDIRDLRIGQSNTCRLGWTSWLGREHSSGLVTLNRPSH
ncbi:type VI secretion system baseplate subunit TssG [Pseudomonas cannabina]|uniref:ImpH n=3 Tax=Pseudomonas syringae group TaxID=136849 RepID=I0BW28_PSECA|nr:MULTISPECIES: type VI secretion system baseplate subunit TssG [Pseudomonas syringae group]AFH66626.1 ImpH [Pseudomonas cannabina]KPB71105.1 ImpH [Pseudomonas syringae pv. maculicola]KPW17568.1 ImpH [Pseudomonas cannabina pv. alisalensis]MBM0140400.1 type VI secretion system baseplate subunit TssG [Pseudomonas cannabina pv. alisalensis]QHE97049.1 type VI secretion system baseplate subunit TssG [Pseudomonas syringae pv. maculicola str. ES4326]